jgi:mRNA-degrading endonuclease HigB of HigAB toxin-antitoxin module
MANKDIKYINRDFDSFRNSLVQFSQNYFPNTYNDFSANSPGSLFLEMASYVGDVLSFYLDNQIQETFLQYARQEPNLYDLAYMMGYTPKATGAATVEVEIYQQVPSKLESGEYVPDYDYALFIEENTSINSTIINNSNFVITDSIDFSFSSSLDPTEVTVYSTNGANVEYFLLKKKRTATSGTIQTTNFTFTNVERYPTVTINDFNIIRILDIIDSDGNEWTEVPYLAQETVFNPIKNKNPFGSDPNAGSEVPFILNLKKVPNRFVSRFKSKTQLDIQFGAGTDQNNIDEVIVPNPNNVGIGLPASINKLTTGFNPSNFLFTHTYGLAPSDTTLTVRYLTGGGVSANINANLINNISTTGVKFQKDNLNSTQAQTIFNSILAINPTAATGGNDGDNIEEIRNNTIGEFGAQLRTVTQEDYLIRALSLPSQFGTIAKSYIEPQKLENILPGESLSVLDLYVLSYNSNKQLTTASTTLKNNLATYLSQYRTINDSINIKNAYIINIGLDFDIIVYPNYNSNEVLTRCIQSLKNYFNIDNQQINQPILLKDIFVLLDKIQGVQTVSDVNIYNKAGVEQGYSQYGYDIKGATSNNIIYPSLDPSIFEIKNPNTDIKGRVVTL